MEKLFVETSGGKSAIDPDVVRKYHLEKGTWSPFLRGRIVGESGDFPAETAAEKDPKNSGNVADPPENEPGGVMLSTSEIIDFAQGSDSTNGR